MRKFAVLLTPLLILALIIVAVGCGGDGEEPTPTPTPTLTPTPTPTPAPPEIDDPISDAELRDLQTIASQEGISLQDAIERYAWNDNFALAVAKIREASPEAFAGAEIIDAGHAWVAFAGRVPELALDMIDTFSSSHKGVSVEMRADLGPDHTSQQQHKPHSDELILL